MTTSLIRQTRHECERVLSAVFGLLIRCGIRPKSISALTNRAFQAATTKAQALGAPSAGELVTLSLVLDAWHRERRYLTSRGRPRAVPLLGEAPSVEALIRAEGPEYDAIALASRVKSLRLISPCRGNRYRPTSDSVLISIYGPTVLQYIAQCLMSLVETVEANLRCAPNVPPLLQRSTEIPDLPSECIESFQEFSRFQGEIFVRTINDWLEARRPRVCAVDPKDNVRAGVHVHAYVTPNGRAPRHGRRCG